MNTTQGDRVIAQLPVSALRTGDARIEQRFGSLELFIDLGGDLSIDGILQGTIAAGSAFVRPQFPAGPHQIEVRKDGYETVRDEVVVLPGQQTQKVYRLAANLPTTPRLDRAFGLIEVTIDRGGTLYIDDKKMEQQFQEHARLESQQQRARQQEQQHRFPLPAGCGAGGENRLAAGASAVTAAGGAPTSASGLRSGRGMLSSSNISMPGPRGNRTKAKPGPGTPLFEFCSSKLS